MTRLSTVQRLRELTSSVAERNRRIENLKGRPRPSLADRAVQRLVRGYFTKTSLLAHAIVYPVLIVLEDGDWHYFLNGISIEAVFIGLLVGVSTKRIIARQHHTHGKLDELLTHLKHDRE